MKKQVMTSIDAELHEEIKKKRLNVSEILETALNKELNKVRIEIDCNLRECGFCGRRGEKATKDDLKGLTWLWPDEKWICESCLKGKCANITK